MNIEKTCDTCYHKYHKRIRYDNCDHMLMCHENDKWIPCTNGDYLRNVMTDAELGKYLCDRGVCHGCIAQVLCQSEDGYIKWLDEPVRGAI